MSKERLEEIKEYFKYRQGTLPDNIRWLISTVEEQQTKINMMEQAVKQRLNDLAEEQQKEIERSVKWKKHAESLSDVVSDLELENKRYREAFKQIKLQILFDGAIEDPRKNIMEIIDEASEVEG